MLSLCVIGIGVLAYLFFGRSDDRVKLWVFGAILLAVIGLATAVLRESRDGTPATSRSTPTDAASPSPSDAATPAVPPDGPKPANAIPSAAPVSTPAATAADVDLSGRWSDEAYTYQVSTQGSHMSYIQMRNGVRVGAGDGTISGRRLLYRFVVDATGEGGVCHGLASADGNTVDGTCIAGGNSYPFSIIRDDR